MSNDKVEPTIGDEMVQETYQEPTLGDSPVEILADADLRERIVVSVANVALFKGHLAKRRDAEAKQDREAWAQELERWADQNPSIIVQAQQVVEQTKTGEGPDWAALDRAQLEALAEAFEAQSNTADTVGGDRYKRWLDKHIGSLAEQIQKDIGGEDAERARKAAKVYALHNFSKLYADQDALKKSWNKDLLRIGGKVALAAFTGNPIGAVFAVIDIAKTLTKDRTADVKAYKQSAKGFDSQAQEEATARGMSADSPKRGFVTGRWAAVIGGAVVAGLAIAGIDAGLDSGLIQVDKAAASVELNEMKDSLVTTFDGATEYASTELSEVKDSLVAAFDGAAERVSTFMPDHQGISIEEAQTFANHAEAHPGLEGTLRMPEVPMPLGMETPLSSNGKEVLESIIGNAPEAENALANLDVAAQTPAQEALSVTPNSAMSEHSNGSITITTGVWGDGVESIDSISELCNALGVDSTPENWKKIAGFIGSESVDLIQANTEYSFTPEQLAELGYEPQSTLSLAQQHAQFGGLTGAPQVETLSLAAQHAAHSHSIDGSEAVVTVTHDDNDSPTPS